MDIYFIFYHLIGILIQQCHLMGRQVFFENHPRADCTVGADLHTGEQNSITAGAAVFGEDDPEMLHAAGNSLAGNIDLNSFFIEAQIGGDGTRPEGAVIGDDGIADEVFMSPAGISKQRVANLGAEPDNTVLTERDAASQESVIADDTIFPDIRRSTNDRKFQNASAIFNGNVPIQVRQR